MKTLKKVLIVVGIIILLLVITGGILYSVYLRPFMQKMEHTSTIKYNDQLTLVIGGGGNTGILTSDSAVIVIDTKMDKAAEDLYATVKQLAGKKPIIVINTHWHGDHTKGNKFYTGQTIMAGGNYTEEGWIKEAGKEGIPTKWVKDRMDIPMGDDTVTVLNLAKNIHTPSDIVVYLHREKMLFGGDVILNKQAAVLFGTADPYGYLAAFDFVEKEFDIKKVVPGHGEVGGVEVIDDFRQYFNDMKLAATDESKKDELVAKYKDWNQIPLLMSPGATIKAFQKKAKE